MHADFKPAPDMVALRKLLEGDMIRLRKEIDERETIIKSYDYVLDRMSEIEHKRDQEEHYG